MCRLIGSLVLLSLAGLRLNYGFFGFFLLFNSTMSLSRAVIAWDIVYGSPALNCHGHGEALRSSKVGVVVKCLRHGLCQVPHVSSHNHQVADAQVSVYSSTTVVKSLGPSFILLL